MGTTPIFAIPYVEPTDTLATFPVSDKAQALAVEAAMALPSWGEWRLNSNQSVASATSTVVSLAYIQGTGSADFSTAAGEVTVNKAGIYVAVAQVSLISPSTAVGNRFGYLMVNAVTQQRGSVTPSPNTATSVGLGKILNVTAGAKVRLNVFHGQGAAIDLDSTNMGTFLTLARL